MSISSITMPLTSHAIVSASKSGANISQQNGFDGFGIGVFKIRQLSPSDAKAFGFSPSEQVLGPSTGATPVSYDDIDVTKLADRSTGDFMDELQSLGSLTAVKLSEPIQYNDPRTGGTMFDMSIPGFHEEVNRLSDFGQQDVRTRLTALFQQEGMDPAPTVTFKTVVNTDNTLSVKAEGDQADAVNALLAKNPDLSIRIRTSLSLTEQSRYLKDADEAMEATMHKVMNEGLSAGNKMSAQIISRDLPKASFTYSSTDGLKALFNGINDKEWQNTYDMFLDALAKQS